MNPRGEYPVLPLLGVQWDFAPKWTASLGFPRTGLLYKASPEVQVRFGADYQGGTYHVNQARAPRLGDTWLDYRDFRLGAGVDLRVSEHVSVALDGGAVVRRRFDYFDRDYRVDGSATTYVTIGLRGRF